MRPSAISGATTLSVCCLTRGPTARVAAQLALFREVADEIVVGLDTSVDADLAHPLAEVADVVVHYPYVDPVDRPVGWIHSLCAGDWILWVDDDEIPSAALVESVRDVIAGGAVTHCYVPRRTLWRDPASVLEGPPWVPDFQLRLVVNDPRLVWFPGITHWPIQAVGPHRYLETPLFHTDLLLTPEERRRAKVRRYETAVPGRRVAGLPLNDAYYLPEDRPSVELVAVESPDCETIARILELEPWPEPRAPSAPLRLATRGEVDEHWHGAQATEDLSAAASRWSRAARRSSSASSGDSSCVSETTVRMSGRTVAWVGRRFRLRTAGSTIPARASSPMASAPGCPRRLRRASRS